MKTVFSLDAVRGALAGLAGVGGGMLFAMAIRMAIGLPAWKSEPVFVVGIFTGVLIWLVALGVWRYWALWAIGAPAKPEPEWREKGWRRYFSVDTNHKVIAVQYIATALFFLPFAIALQIVGRLDLSKLVPPVVGLSGYESVISDHGVTMLFLVVLPMFSGLMNYLVPLLIGAKDMAFPRLNAFSYWLVPPAGLLVAFSLLAGGFDTGWTVYVPLSASFEHLGMDLILIGVYLAGLSSILGSINLLVTIIKLRTKGMTAFRMPVFVWSSLATAGLALVFTQFIGIAFLMVLFQRIWGMGFFDPTKGGQALLYQYLFWFYSHPAVYVFVIPGFGIISDILPVFARKPLFGYKAVAVSSPGIAIGGMFVFAHHMFAAGMPAVLRIPFMVTTLLVAVPTGIKIFAWAATAWLGRLIMVTPLLFVLSSILMFLIGGLTGVVVGIVPVDLYVHDTYFVVGHFHATLFGGFLMPAMAALYYWFPKASGRRLSERLGVTQWALMTIGMVLIVLPMLGLGLEGMRRRVADYPPNQGLQPLHIATLIGAVLVFAAVVILVINLVRSARTGEKAGPNPWNARTLEWQTSSPPPEDNFETVPEVIGPPYGYGVPGLEHTRPMQDGVQQGRRDNRGGARGNNR